MFRFVRFVRFYCTIVQGTDHDITCTLMRYLRMLSKFAVVTASPCWGINSKLSKALLWDLLRFGLQTQKHSAIHVHLCEYSLICASACVDLFTCVVVRLLWWQRCSPRPWSSLLSRLHHSPVDSSTQWTRSPTSELRAPGTDPAGCTCTQSYTQFKIKK